MDHKSLPEQKHDAQPFTFGAFTTKNLIRGELVVFNVDASGRVTCDKLDFIRADTLRLAKAPAVA